ncbi:Uma2 family endonuclease [Cyanobacteria bacterium FACHB-472]|nr:Uma2 family endonuclease [Cyanobacteria bacterium FACHB-472]
MTSAETPFAVVTLPDHTQLPESDGTFVKNFQEPPQGDLLTHTIEPVLQQIHPDGQYCIGRDSGIYWRITEPPERGAEAPDWFYVPNVPPTLNGQYRRSYVLWQEYVAPLIVLEFVSGDGSQERDRTPITGKFWVYEQAIRVPFYGIYEVNLARVEVYQLINGRYHVMQPNERGRYLIEPLGVELGIWQGRYTNMEFPWLRWWDAQGNLLLDGTEIAQLAQSQLEEERDRAQRLAERLRAMDVNPDELT